MRGDVSLSNILCNFSSQKKKIPVRKKNTKENFIAFDRRLFFYQHTSITCTHSGNYILIIFKIERNVTASFLSVVNQHSQLNSHNIQIEKKPKSYSLCVHKLREIYFRFLSICKEYDRADHFFFGFRSKQNTVSLVIIISLLRLKHNYNS